MEAFETQIMKIINKYLNIKKENSYLIILLFFIIFKYKSVYILLVEVINYNKSLQ